MKPNTIPLEQAAQRLRAIACAEPVRSVSQALGSTAQLYFVGGIIRDTILGIEGSDIDLATSLEPYEIEQRLSTAQIRTIPTGLKHQTVTALVEPGHETVEITTFRAAGMSPSGGLRSSATIREDLRYRDFTINALAFPASGSRAADFLGDLEDLGKGIVRCVGNPSDRFGEDPLRIIRLARFCSELRFEADESTFDAARRQAFSLSEVHVERIREELSRILIAPAPDLGIAMLERLNALEFVLPELLPCVAFEQNRFHKTDLFNHTLEVVRRSPPDLVVRLAALLHDIGKPPTLSIDPQTGDRHFYRHEAVGTELATAAMRRLRYPNDVIEAVNTLVRLHMRPFDLGPGGMRRLLRDAGEQFDRWRELKIADASACKVGEETVREQAEQFDRALAVIRSEPQVSPLSALAVRGNDLLALGVPEGPLVGKILRALHELVLDSPALNDRDKLLSLVPSLRDGLS